VRFVIPLVFVTFACGSPETHEVNADALTLLKRAIEFRDSSFADWRNACVVLTLQESPVAEGRSAGPVRIPTEWVANRRTTEDRYGCDATLVYSRPYFSREKALGEFAFVEVDRLCGPLCGDNGSIAFFRPNGSSDWQPLGFDQGPAY
jgi:hypothetical protein